MLEKKVTKSLNIGMKRCRDQYEMKKQKDVRLQEEKLRFCFSHAWFQETARRNAAVDGEGKKGKCESHQH